MAQSISSENEIIVVDDEDSDEAKETSSKEKQGIFTNSLKLVFLLKILNIKKLVIFLIFCDVFLCRNNRSI